MMARTSVALLATVLAVLIPIGNADKCTDNIEVSLGSARILHRDFMVSFINNNNVNASDIRVTCGQFIDDFKIANARASPSEDKVKRVGPAECLLNGGQAVLPGEDVTFRYDNYWWAFKKVFHFQVLSATCASVGNPPAPDGPSFDGRGDGPDGGSGSGGHSSHGRSGGPIIISGDGPSGGSGSGGTSAHRSSGGPIFIGGDGASSSGGGGGASSHHRSSDPIFIRGDGASSGGNSGGGSGGGSSGPIFIRGDGASSGGNSGGGSGGPIFIRGDGASSGGNSGGGSGGNSGGGDSGN